MGQPSQGFLKHKQRNTLLETNMETQQGPYKDYSPSKRGLYGLHASLWECNIYHATPQPNSYCPSFRLPNYPAPVPKEDPKYYALYPRPDSNGLPRDQFKKRSCDSVKQSFQNLDLGLRLSIITRPQYGPQYTIILNIAIQKKELLVDRKTPLGAKGPGFGVECFRVECSWWLQCPAAVPLRI